MTALALEIGSGQFAASLIADDVEEDEIRRAPIPAHGAWNGCLNLLREAAADREVTSLGIACPGPIDMAAGLVAPAEIDEWQTGFGILEAARREFPAASVRLALDGVCFAVAEHNFGATHAVLDSLALVVSDRIAAGVMVGGCSVVGRTGNAGNIGHLLVPGFDEICSCGGRGCLEAVAGGASVVRWARAQGWAGTTVSELIDETSPGDEVLTAALGRAGTALGRAIASVAALLDIDTVVVGGVLAGAGPALWEPLGAAVTAHGRLGYLSGLRVVPSDLGQLGVLAGAGVLALTAQP
ncbi:ROK family protein [Nocardia sp. CDC160]|uniref:ROK family protein n=1 Tax=Nocardia sp. CDC160 TaxID=3112166 RepID=UPI002DBF4590|nr:ROK family protein [Nocardia sp. CDC160]MEC3920671.1 ROK family protein [Nocardia sp. CDC160]